MITNSLGFDTSYNLSVSHKPYLVTGYLNDDTFLDTAIIIRDNMTKKDALLIKHGNTNQVFIFKNGKDLGQKFEDFNWVELFSIAKKGGKIWDNVIDGEIVGEAQIPESKKILLKNDGIFVHVDEASGGGIIYFKDGNYHWVQQD